VHGQNPMGEEGRLPGAHVALFTPGQATFACIFGTLAAGGLVVALNHDRLGRRNTAIVSFFLGLLGAAVLLAVAFATPDKGPWTAVLRYVGLAAALGVRQHAQRTQKPWVDAHLAAGGKRASW